MKIKIRKKSLKSERELIEKTSEILARADLGCSSFVARKVFSFSFSFAEKKKKLTVGVEGILLTGETAGKRVFVLSDGNNTEIKFPKGDNDERITIFKFIVGRVKRNIEGVPLETETKTSLAKSLGIKPTFLRDRFCLKRSKPMCLWE